MMQKKSTKAQTNGLTRQLPHLAVRLFLSLLLLWLATSQTACSARPKVVVLESEQMIVEADAQHYTISKAYMQKMLKRIVYLEKELEACKTKK